MPSEYRQGHNGNCLLSRDRGSVSNHIVKLDSGINVPLMARCISIGECESCGGSIVVLEIEMMEFIDLEVTERDLSD